MSDKDCIYCHQGMTFTRYKYPENLKIGRDIKYYCTNCKYTCSHWYNTMCYIFTGEDGHMISIYSDARGWFTRFHSPDEACLLEFKNPIWIFPQNIDYWINRFKLLTIIS